MELEEEKPLLGSENESTHDSDNAATRGQRRGFYWQDWYAAWTMLRCIAEPATGIVGVELETAGAPHIDDVVVHRIDAVEYRQLKHTVHEDRKMTGSDLFAVPEKGLSLLGKLYKGWNYVKRRGQNPVRVTLTTNADGSARSNNLLVSPVDFESNYVIPARIGPWPHSAQTAEITDRLQALTGAPDLQTLREFLAAFHLEFGVPNETALRLQVVALLRRMLRSDATLELDADAWTMGVYDMSTRYGEVRLYSKEDIERELRLRLRQSRIADHRIALPEHHVPRSGLVDEILRRAEQMGEGFLQVLGPPGCGKTTLATLLANEHDDEVLVRYHVFDPSRASGLERAGRASALTFVRTMFDALADRFPQTVASRLPAEDMLPESVGVLRDQLAQLAGKRGKLVIVDGIDHVVRAGMSRGALFDALPLPVPSGVVFVLFGQPDWEYPPWLRQAPQIDVPPFQPEETRRHVCERLGWDPATPSAAPVCDLLHHRSGGNPLSLFYNISLVHRLGTRPDDVLAKIQTVQLFGNSPHQEYERLLQDLEAIVARQQASRSLRRDLMAFVSVSTAAVTETRLAQAFLTDGTSSRQARDYIEALRPVLVERGKDRYWLFHDDFRRFAEERMSADDRAEAHHRVALGLEGNWESDEVAAFAEHLWCGRRYERLAHLPHERQLAAWFQSASPHTVVTLHRLALGAAFRCYDDILILKNSLAAARAVEAADLPWRPRESPDPELGLRGWSFQVPPRERTVASLHIRASALRAASDGCAENPAMAAEIAARFEMAPADIPPAEGHEWHLITEYVEALVDWWLQSGHPARVAQILVDDRFGQQAMEAVKHCFELGTNAAALQEWARVLVGLDAHMDRDLVGVALNHFVEGRHSSSAPIARTLLECPASNIETRRDAGVITSISEGALLLESSSLDAQVRCEGREATNPLEWREFFNDGFVTAALGPVRELELHEFPIEPVPVNNAGSYGPSLGRVLSFIWRCGCAAGLAMRGASLLSTSDLDRLVDPLLAPRMLALEPMLHNSFVASSSVYFPLLAAAFREDAVLSSHMKKRMATEASRLLSQPCQRLYGALEALWILDPHEWQELARRAQFVEYLEGTDASERTSWISYWLDRNSERNVDVQPEFRAKLQMGRMGVPRKSDPARLAVDLFCASSASIDDPTSLVRRLDDLMIQISREPEGDRAARWQLPRVLSVALDLNPSLFEMEFERCVLQQQVAEPFNDMAADVAVHWLERTGRVEPNELIALWHWIAACPGSFREEADGAKAAGLIVGRLSQSGAEAAAREIEVWMSALEPERPAHPHEDSHLVEDVPVPPIEGLRARWLTPGWSSQEHRALQDFLLAKGNEGWHWVCDRLSEELAASSDSDHHFTTIAEGICELRSELPKDQAIDLIMHHIAEKVRFQPAPELAAPSTLTNQDRVDVFIRLIVKGLQVDDTETVRRALRSLAALAHYPWSSRAIIQELCPRLQSVNVRLVTYALLVLGEMPSLPTECLSELEKLRLHEDAWCRHLACRLLGEQPTWPPVRAILFGKGLYAADVGPDRSNPSEVYYSSPTSVRERYLKKFSQLVNASDSELRSWLETEYRVLPASDLRPVAWKQKRGPSFNDGAMADAAGRLAARLASTVSEGRIPVLLSAVARFDPWLATAAPMVPRPDGMLELCRAEWTFEHAEQTFILRWLAVLAEGSDSTLQGLSPADLVKLAASMLAPRAPVDYAWVAECWKSVDPPLMPAGPITPLSFRNSSFTELHRTHFDLVPNWTLPMFRELHFQIGESPRWVHPDLGAVVIAGWGERAVPSDGIEHPAASWWTDWAASPNWLVSALPVRSRLVRCERRALTNLRRRSQTAEPLVQYTLEEIKLPA